MFKKIGSLLVTLLALALLVYSATRSLSFISLTLPPDRQILAWFGLAALDGGLICWLLAYLYGSRGGWQRGISLLMVIVDLAGCVLMFTADSLYETGKAGLTTVFTADEMFMFVIALSGIIAINIAATVAHHLTDPDKLKDQQEEEAFAKINELAVKKLSENADALAAELAPQIADDWQRQTRAKYMNLLGKSNGFALPSPTDNAIEVIATNVPEKKTRRWFAVPPQRRAQSVYHSDVEVTDNLPKGG